MALGLAIGHADTVRLLAANAFLAAIRAVGTLQVVPPLAQRIGANEAIWKKSMRRAWRLDLISLAACAALAMLLVGLLDLRGMSVAATMLAILSISLPARTPGRLLAAKRRRIAHWRVGASAVALVGGLAVLGLELPWQAAALVLAARDWGGLLMALAFSPPRKLPKTIAHDPLMFSEVAGSTEGSARRRLSYRMLKSLLVGVLGPAGNFAARTSRGARLDSRLASMVPRHRGGMLVFAATTLAVSLFFLIVSREPSTLLLSGAFARLTGSAWSAILWWNYGTDLVGDEDDDDD